MAGVKLVDKTRLQERAAAAPDLSATAKLVLFVLLFRFWNTETGQCNPRLEAIGAAVGGLSRRRVSAALAELVDADVIEQHRGRGAPSYTFDLEWTNSSTQSRGKSGRNRLPNEQDEWTKSSSLEWTSSSTPIEPKNLNPEERDSPFPPHALESGPVDVDPIVGTVPEQPVVRPDQPPHDIDTDPDPARAPPSDASASDAPPSGRGGQAVELDSLGQALPDLFPPPAPLVPARPAPLEGEILMPRTKATDDADFDRFWSVYPRRVDKGQALRAWRTAIKRASADTIIAGAERYAAERRGEDAQYTKHPATWLNAWAWANEPTPPRRRLGKVQDALQDFVDRKDNLDDLVMREVFGKDGHGK